MSIDQHHVDILIEFVHQLMSIQLFPYVPNMRGLTKYLTRTLIVFALLSLILTGYNIITVSESLGSFPEITQLDSPTTNQVLELDEAEEDRYELTVHIEFTIRDPGGQNTPKITKIRVFLLYYNFWRVFIGSEFGWRIHISGWLAYGELYMGDVDISGDKLQVNTDTKLGALYDPKTPITLSRRSIIENMFAIIILLMDSDCNEAAYIIPVVLQDTEDGIRSKEFNLKALTMTPPRLSGRRYMLSEYLGISHRLDGAAFGFITDGSSILVWGARWVRVCFGPRIRIPTCGLALLVDRPGVYWISTDVATIIIAPYCMFAIGLFFYISASLRVLMDVYRDLLPDDRADKFSLFSSRSVVLSMLLVVLLQCVSRFLIVVLLVSILSVVIYTLREIRHGVPRPHHFLVFILAIWLYCAFLSGYAWDVIYLLLIVLMEFLSELVSVFISSIFACLIYLVPFFLLSKLYDTLRDVLMQDIRNLSYSLCMRERLSVAVKLFHGGILPGEKAAEFAGVSPQEFLRELIRRKKSK